MWFFKISSYWNMVNWKFKVQDLKKDYDAGRKSHEDSGWGKMNKSASHKLNINLGVWSC